MRITMKTLYAGPLGTVQPGQTVDWPDRRQAEQLIADGYAVPGDEATVASAGGSAARRAPAKRAPARRASAKAPAEPQPSEQPPTEPPAGEPDGDGDGDQVDGGDAGDQEG